MTTQTTRVAVLPRETAARVIAAAVSRSAWGVSIVILVVTLPVLVDVLVEHGLPGSALLPLAAVLGMAGLVVLAGCRPGTGTRLLLLLGGGVCSAGYATALLVADPVLNGDSSFLLNRLAMVLVFCGASVATPLAGLVWGAAGYTAGMLGLLLASSVAGVGFEPGWGPSIALWIYAGALLALAAIDARQARRIPDLARLEADTRRLAVEDQFEQRAAAIVHDTVLSDLTAVMNSSGRLDPRARARFRADVATLGDAAWLRESAVPGLASGHDARLRNALELLVSDFQWRGLRVDVTGDHDAVVHTSPDAASSILAAVRACLDNVLQHAGTSAAELVVSTADDAVTVMVVDHGRGFEPDAVAPDRLGLRSAVVSRIRSHGGFVRVWSAPGEGTSVLLCVPSAAVRSSVAEQR